MCLEESKGSQTTWGGGGEGVRGIEADLRGMLIGQPFGAHPRIAMEPMKIIGIHVDDFREEP